MNHSFKVGEIEGESSLIEFLSEKYPFHSVKTLRRFIHEGGVLVHQKVAQANQILSVGDEVELTSPLPERDFRSRFLPLSILYEDQWLVVLSKPSGVPVIPGNDGAVTVMEGLLHHWKGGGRPRVIHRLDLETSGVLAVGKDRKAASMLSQDFEDRKISKEYLAFVQGIPASMEGEINFPLQDTKKGKKREAHTQYRVLETFGGISLLLVKPLTGRMHQIRIHLSSLGNPLVVDPLYKGKKALFLSEIKRKYRPKKGRPESPLVDRLTLHSLRLSFTHPIKGEEMTFEAPLPEDLQRLQEVLRKYGSSGQTHKNPL